MRPTFTTAKRKIKKNIFLQYGGCRKLERERWSLGRGGNLGGLGLLSMTIFKDGKLDSFVLGDGDQRVKTLSDDKDVGQTSGKSVSSAVFDMDDVVASGVFLSALDDTNTTQIASSGDHGEVANIELDKVHHLPFIQVVLNGVVFLNVRVGIADGSSVVSDKNGHSLFGDEEFSDTEKLEL